MAASPAVSAAAAAAAAAAATAACCCWPNSSAAITAVAARPEPEPEPTAEPCAEPAPQLAQALPQEPGQLYQAKLMELKRLKAGGAAAAALKRAGAELAVAKAGMRRAGMLKAPTKRQAQFGGRRQGSGAGALRRARFAADGPDCSAFQFVLHESPQPGELPDYRAAAVGGHQSRGALVVAIHDTSSLRRLSRKICTAADRVFEIGCSYGACSAVLCEASPAYFLGIDNSEECVVACRAALPSANFRRLDALLGRDTLQALVRAERPTLLVVDVGGIRALADVMELLEGLVSALGTSSQSLLLVKAEKLVHAARTQLRRADGDADGAETAAALRERVVACPGGWWAEAREALGGSGTPPTPRARPHTHTRARARARTHAHARTRTHTHAHARTQQLPTSTTTHPLFGGVATGPRETVPKD